MLSWKQVSKNRWWAVAANERQFIISEFENLQGNHFTLNELTPKEKYLMSSRQIQTLKDRAERELNETETPE